MNISPNGIKAIKKAEGTSKSVFTGKHTVYSDAVGRLTVGYGHALSSADVTNNVFKNGLTDEEADALLSKDLVAAEAAVNRLVSVTLNQDQFDALVDFVFNLGARRFANSTLLKLINAQDFAAVPAELGKWNKGVDPRTGKRVELPGLTTRRAAEAQRFPVPAAPHSSPSAAPGSSASGSTGGGGEHPHPGEGAGAGGGASPHVDGPARPDPGGGSSMGSETDPSPHTMP